MLDAKAEMEGLWTAVFGEPPAVDAGPDVLAELILKCSGPPPVYGMEPPPERRAPDVGAAAGASQGSR